MSQHVALTPGRAGTGAESSPSDLFRKRAMSVRTRGTLGGVRLAAQSRYTGFSLAGIAFTAAMALYAAIGTVHRQERLVGLLAPVGGPIALASTSAGIVIARLHQEGEFVAAGSPILEITSDRSVRSGEVTEILGKLVTAKLATIDRASSVRAEQETVRTQQINAQLAWLASERTLASHSARLSQERVRLAEQKLKL